MAQVSSISSNRTKLSITQESSIGVLPGTPVWYEYEPNSYADFGGTLTTTPRTPIKADRMARKGPITDLEAKAGFNSDLTKSNMASLLQGFFFANFRRKTEKIKVAAEISAVTASSDTYTVNSGGASFLAGSLVWASGFTNAANNGLKVVASSTGTTVVVGDGLVDETPPVGASLVVVGHQFGSGDLDVNQGVSILPTLTATSKDLTTLGLVPGEIIWIGGDLTAEKFATAANNGFARVRSITTTTITLDKTDGTMLTEDANGKTIRLFFGRVLKNETGAQIVRTTFQLERQLGAPDTGSTDVQSEYIVGAVPSELTINLTSADKITLDAAFMGLDHEPVAAGSLKGGTRPALVAEDAFNSTSNVVRLKFSQASGTVSNMTALFSHLSDTSISINNNITLNKAIGSLGGFEATEGNFGVSLETEAYFGNVSALSAVRANDDLTLDVLIASNNAGIAIDIPLIAGSGALAKVDADAPIKLSLTSEGANGIDVASGYNHVMLMVFFDYLPTAAM
jgi:hypothetical protein